MAWHSQQINNSNGNVVEATVSLHYKDIKILVDGELCLLLDFDSASQLARILTEQVARATPDWLDQPNQYVDPFSIPRVKL